VDSETSTKAKIVNCFLDMLAERPYDELSIGDVSASAGVSRQTFYYHFDNLFDVCQHVIDTERERRGRRYSHTSLLDNLTEDAITLFSQKKLIMAVYESRSRGKLEASIFDNSYHMTRNHFESKSIIENEYDLDTICRFLAHAYTGLTMEWIGEGMPDKLKDINRIVRTIVNYGTIYGSVLGAQDKD